MKERIFDKYYKKIFQGTKQEFFEELEKRLKENNKKTFIVTANPETIMTAENNQDFKNAILDERTIIVPDGIGVIYGAKKLKYDKIKETITGVEVSTKLLELCNKYQKSIYLYGAKQNVIDEMQKMIKKTYPQIKIVGAQNGYIKDNAIVSEEIKNLKPDVTMVALGIPRQELFIYQNLDEFSNGIFIGVGGTFDVLSGTKKRAPEIFIKTKTEWLYRITREPKRLKRFYNNNIKFLFKLKR